MIKMLNNIFIMSYVIWLFILPIGIYHGYTIGKNEFKKIPYYYNSGLIIILPNSIENFTIFTYCCICGVASFGISIFCGFLLYLLLSLFEITVS